MPLDESGSLPPEVVDVQSLPLAVGTPVQFVKIDPMTREVVFGGPSIVGGLVHASVGKKGYVYHPGCEKFVAEDLPGVVLYTAKTNTIKSIELRSGVYFLTTISGSVYQVVLLGGESILAKPNEQPRQPNVTDDRSVSGVATTVQDKQWTLRSIFHRLTGGK